MSEKFTDFTIKNIVSPIIGDEFIDLMQNTSFLVTFKTGAKNDGHNAWLDDEFEKWKKWIEKNSAFSVNWIKLKKGTGGKSGIAEIGMKIKGVFSAKTSGNTSFISSLSAMIRKVLAEHVTLHFHPNFDLKNPLFDALHHHKYVFSLCTSDWEKGQKKIDSLLSNTFVLETVTEDCGAMVVDPAFEIMLEDSLGNTLYSITLRWKQDAPGSKIETLEKVIKAYFAGLGFTITEWGMESIGKQQPK